MNNGKLIMERVALVISPICNLNCRLCGMYSPYSADKAFPSMSEVKSYIKNLFDTVDFVEQFSFSGGETLLYKQLPEAVGEILNYSNKIGKVEIITNGTIVPSDELILAVKKLGGKFYRFLVDDYGENLSKKVKEIDKVLSASGLKYEIRNYNNEDMHCGGWIDAGSLEEKLYSYEEAAKVYAKCANPQKLHFCFDYLKGILFPCGPVYRRFSLGQDVDKSDYVDLTDKSLSIEEQRQKISNIYNSKCLESCMYCAGWCDDSPRFKPAEQFTPEEIREIRTQNGRAVK